MISKEDFVDWKANPVTKAVSAGLQAKIEQFKEILGKQAGEDQLRDRYIVGGIAGIEEFLNVSMEDIAND